MFCKIIGYEDQTSPGTKLTSSSYLIFTALYGIFRPSDWESDSH